MKQVDAIHHQHNNNRSKSKGRAMEAIEVTADLNLGSLVLVQIVVPVTHPGSVKHMAKSAFTATKRGISVNYVIPDNVENPQVQG